MGWPLSMIRPPQHQQCDRRGGTGCFKPWAITRVVRSGGDQLQGRWIAASFRCRPPERMARSRDQQPGSFLQRWPWPGDALPFAAREALAALAHLRGRSLSGRASMKPLASASWAARANRRRVAPKLAVGPDVFGHALGWYRNTSDSTKSNQPAAELRSEAP